MVLTSMFPLHNQNFSFYFYCESCAREFLQQFSFFFFSLYILTVSLYRVIYIYIRVLLRISDFAVLASITSCTYESTNKPRSHFGFQTLHTKVLLLQRHSFAKLCCTCSLRHLLYHLSQGQSIHFHTSTQCRHRSEQDGSINFKRGGGLVATLSISRCPSCCS